MRTFSNPTVLFPVVVLLVVLPKATWTTTTSLEWFSTTKRSPLHHWSLLSKASSHWRRSTKSKFLVFPALATRTHSHFLESPFSSSSLRHISIIHARFHHHDTAAAHTAVWHGILAVALATVSAAIVWILHHHGSHTSWWRHDFIHERRKVVVLHASWRHISTIITIMATWSLLLSSHHVSTIRAIHWTVIKVTIHVVAINISAFFALGIIIHFFGIVLIGLKGNVLKSRRGRGRGGWILIIGIIVLVILVGRVDSSISITNIASSHDATVSHILHGRHCLWINHILLWKAIDIIPVNILCTIVRILGISSCCCSSRRSWRRRSAAEWTSRLMLKGRTRIIIRFWNRAVSVSN
mmetsp:Transcript_13491/g.32546  ORF Transcript_13491/g.32546 Transcript_13491/m.32546 type:complete len:353 (-) Transcript_13491:341-1399(-)